MSSPVALTVGNRTDLSFEACEENSCDPTMRSYVFSGNLTCGGVPIAGRSVKIVDDCNDTVCCPTNGDGTFTIRYGFGVPETMNMTFQVTFEGEDGNGALASDLSPNGTEYATCTTAQFTYLPSGNSTILRVDPVRTEATIPEKTAEETASETEWLQTWGPDSFSLWPPFFKIHAKLAVDWLGMNAHSWVGLLAAGIDSYDGFGRLLEDALNVAPAAMDVVTSAIISSMTATMILFITAATASYFTSFTPGYIVTLLSYIIGGWSIITGIDLLVQDAYMSKAILLGIGFTLLGMLIGAVTADTLAKSIPFVINAELTGGDVVRKAVKSIVNSLVSKAIGFLTGLTSALFCSNLLMNLFGAATAGFAGYAIYLGWKKR